MTEDAPEWVWNAQWRKVIGTSTFLETKFTGYSGYYYLDPVDPSPFTYDGLIDEYTGGGGGLEIREDRSRNQVQVALTRIRGGIREGTRSSSAPRSSEAMLEPSISPMVPRVSTSMPTAAFRITASITATRFKGDNKRVLCVCAGSVGALAV